MEQRISLVTLGVADVRRSREFYERLGWQGFEMEETVFFQAGGQAVVLWGDGRGGQGRGRGVVGSPKGVTGGGDAVDALGEWPSRRRSYFLLRSPARVAVSTVVLTLAAATRSENAFERLRVATRAADL